MDGLIDGNEVHRAKLMLDDIFGDENVLGTLVWEKADSPRMDAHTFSSSNDFILAYAKNTESMVFQRIEADDQGTPDHYNQTDETGRAFYLKPLRSMGGQGETREARPNLYYAMTAPDGTKVFPKRQDGSDGAWRWSREKVQAEAARIEWRAGKNGWTPYFRIYADTSGGRPPETIWYHQDVGSSRAAKAQIKNIFGEVAFDTPKPLGLLSRVIEIASEPDFVILDSFAGSGTTGHAVLEANKRDGGNRRFILVELEEYADKLTAERIRRVIKGYNYKGTQKTELLRENLNWRALQKADQLVHKVEGIENLHGHEFDRIKKEIANGEMVVTGEKAVAERVEGLGGSFTYCTLGEPVELDKILTGKALPTFTAIGSVLFHMATSRVADPAGIKEAEFYVGETEGEHVWLIYRADLEWLKSPDAALTLKRAKGFAEAKPGKKHLVFAPSRFVSQKLLDEQNIPVEFVPLPFALYRIERD